MFVVTNSASRWRCSGSLTMDRRELEQRVLVALSDKLMRRVLFEDLRKQIRSRVEQAPDGVPCQALARRKELPAVEREIPGLVAREKKFKSRPRNQMKKGQAPPMSQCRYAEARLQRGGERRY
jgi:hypothetical protein